MGDDVVQLRPAGGPHEVRIDGPKADLIVITPTRGRPGQFAELADAIRATADFDVALVGLVDDDDPDLLEYNALAGGIVHLLTGPRRSLSGWTNRYARHAALQAPYLASLGDDHLPRTRGWDRLLVSAIRGLAGPGFAYGNDLYQGRALPTAWVASSATVRELGWMMLPGCEHMYVDTAILALGRAADRIAYVPEVVIEHRHPLAGKADWDASYGETNTDARYAADKAAYDAWLTCGLATDAAAVRALTHRTGG
jgi:hypothetical protein